MPNPDQQIKVKVKICGIREPEHAQAAIEARADFLGMVFADVPRRIAVTDARLIRSMVGPRVEIANSSVDAFNEAIQLNARPLLVGVFARQSAEEINKIVDETDIDIVQLSGGEHPLMATRCNRPVIRAVHVKNNSHSDNVLGEAMRLPRTVSLLDAPSAEGGGSGECVDWKVASRVAKAIPIMLAGGLNPENVQNAIEQVHPWAVDVSSGIEIAGRKDTGKIVAFLTAAKQDGNYRTID